MQLTGRHWLQNAKAAACVSLALAGCAPATANLALIDGPPISDVQTPFDAALVCLDGRISKNLAFAVGNIADATGREQFGDGGSGKFVTQGAANIVQSSLFKTGVTLINRRDLSVPIQEGQLGVRSLQTQRPADLFVSGTITTLDFIPGGGAFLAIGGVGPRYRQSRIAVSLDLAMTSAQTGQIVANIALNKQIFADEFGFSFSRIEGNSVVDADIAAARREALNASMRQMLQLATFELLTQLMPPEEYEDCSVIVDETGASIDGVKTTGEQRRNLQAEREAVAQALAAAGETPQTPQPQAPAAEAPQPAAPAPADQENAAPAQADARAEPAPDSETPANAVSG